jgi:hypothetical protein
MVHSPTQVSWNKLIFQEAIHGALTSPLSWIDFHKMIRRPPSLKSLGAQWVWVVVEKPQSSLKTQEYGIEPFVDQVGVQVYINVPFHVLGQERHHVGLSIKF